MNWWLHVNTCIVLYAVPFSFPLFISYSFPVRITFFFLQKTTHPRAMFNAVQRTARGTNMPDITIHARGVAHSSPSNSLLFPAVSLAGCAGAEVELHWAVTVMKDDFWFGAFPTGVLLMTVLELLVVNTANKEVHYIGREGAIGWKCRRMIKLLTERLHTSSLLSSRQEVFFH